MKALDCPSCGAPISLKKGIKTYKCSFCENEFQPDYESADEFEGLTQKKLDKFKKRADTAFERGLIEKAFRQYLTLAALLVEDYEKYDFYIPIKVRCHTCEMNLFLNKNYSVPDGATLVDIQNRAYTADIDNPPEFYYARIDGPMIEIIEVIEDECEKMKELEAEEILKKGTAQSYAIRCYAELKLLFSIIIPPAIEHIYLNCSYANVPGWNQYGSWIDEKALSGPVYLGLQLNAEYLEIFMKFLEIIDIGENYTSTEEDDSPILSINLWGEARDLMAGINLHQIALVKRHPKSAYTLNAIKDVSTVAEFFDSFEKLDKKLEPARQGAFERTRQKEEKAKLEAEQKKIEAEKRRKEYEASPEYAKLKRNRKNSFLMLGGLIGIFVITGLITSEPWEKNKIKERKPVVDLYVPKLKLSRNLMEICSGSGTVFADPIHEMNPKKRGEALYDCVDKNVRLNSRAPKMSYEEKEILESLKLCVEYGFLNNMEFLHTENKGIKNLNGCLATMDRKYVNLIDKFWFKPISTFRYY